MLIICQNFHEVKFLVFTWKYVGQHEKWAWFTYTWEPILVTWQSCVSRTWRLKTGTCVIIVLLQTKAFTIHDSNRIWKIRFFDLIDLMTYPWTQFKRIFIFFKMAKMSRKYQFTTFEFSCGIKTLVTELCKRWILINFSEAKLWEKNPQLFIFQYTFA